MKVECEICGYEKIAPDNTKQYDLYDKIMLFCNYCNSMSGFTEANDPEIQKVTNEKLWD